MRPKHTLCGEHPGCGPLLALGALVSAPPPVAVAVAVAALPALPRLFILPGGHQTNTGGQ